MNNGTSKEEVQALEYWMMSKVWHGRSISRITIGELIDNLATLADQPSRPVLDSRVCALLDKVIMNKRSRKTRGPQNLVILNEKSLLGSMCAAGGPESLIGAEIRIKVNVPSERTA